MSKSVKAKSIVLLMVLSFVFTILFGDIDAVAFANALLPEDGLGAADKEKPKKNKVVHVTVNPNKTLFTSGLRLGATHTHYYWELGAPEAVERARGIFESFSDVNNQHIMGWGADNPWPKEDGPMSFGSLDYRIGLMKSLGGEPMITLCQAPGWMKHTDDWNMEAAVKDEHIEDFAKLSAEIAKRYPEVKYFQVWNEFKGYWNVEKNRWDYERYTEMYNQVYAAIKEVRPDAKVGGFYLVLEGDGSHELFGVNGTHDYMPLSDFQKEAIRYWLDNKVGADFISIDRGIVDYHNNTFIPTPEQTIVLTSTFEKVFRELTELTDLPIVLSEYYGYPLEKDGVRDRTLEAAQYASIYKNILTGSRGRDVTALLWVEWENTTPGSLFSDTDSPDGGVAFEHAEVVQNISQYFSKGKDIVEASADSDDVIVLASKEKIMLVNATSSTIEVRLNRGLNKGHPIELSPFEVRFLDI